MLPMRCFVIFSTQNPVCNIQPALAPCPKWAPLVERLANTIERIQENLLCFHARASNLNFLSFSDHASKCRAQFFRKEGHVVFLILEPDILSLYFCIVNKVN